MRGKEEHLQLSGLIKVNDFKITSINDSFAWSEEEFYKALRSKIGTDAVKNVVLSVNGSSTALNELLNLLESYTGYGGFETFEILFL